MLATERHSKILENVNKEKTVTVAELSKLLDVSEVTIRKDLIKLEQEGLLSRVHGGASIAGFLPLERSFTEKQTERMEEKARIARQALLHVQPGDTLILGAGTTTMELAKLLGQVAELTVVTNAVNIAMELNSHGVHQVILIGGEMRAKSFAVVGAVAEDNLKKLSVYKCFIGADGIHEKDGFSTLSLAESHVNRIMMERARKVYVLADHTKFGESHFSSFADLSAVDRIITDRLDAQMQASFLDLGVKIEVAQG
ncbi:DeoR/GlpR family DNA-binding transcription regulator [Brevibacillus choshinensis]|uniref:DeoR/GlpR transcriptional regulator n=1 Tax=Brevibacillus choshinensis TaxID=54911 RepID=A0ABX7FLC7_BRECH|nr:DeoR/GlpR family DNA-binding transcription regulator [Brevibacillus choshinensis]QRG66548.1 DeoR/GlpR transcriptional regulator [Brevibacillus choshinensis]